MCSPPLPHSNHVSHTIRLEGAPLDGGAGEVSDSEQEEEEGEEDEDEVDDEEGAGDEGEEDEVEDENEAKEEDEGVQTRPQGQDSPRVFLAGGMCLERVALYHALVHFERRLEAGLRRKVKHVLRRMGYRCVGQGRCRTVRGCGLGFAQLGCGGRSSTSCVAWDTGTCSGHQGQRPGELLAGTHACVPYVSTCRTAVQLNSFTCLATMNEVGMPLYYQLPDSFPTWSQACLNTSYPRPRGLTPRPFPRSTRLTRAPAASHLGLSRVQHALPAPRQPHTSAFPVCNTPLLLRQQTPFPKQLQPYPPQQARSPRPSHPTFAPPCYGMHKAGVKCPKLNTHVAEQRSRLMPLNRHGEPVPGDAQTAAWEELGFGKQHRPWRNVLYGAFQHLYDAAVEDRYSAGVTVSAGVCQAACT